jgi:hypothetical protein
MSVTGKIGDKVEMKVDYNTEATFDSKTRLNSSTTVRKMRFCGKLKPKCFLTS